MDITKWVLKWFEPKVPIKEGFDITVHPNGSASIDMAEWFASEEGQKMLKELQENTVEESVSDALLRDLIAAYNPNWKASDVFNELGKYSVHSALVELQQLRSSMTQIHDWVSSIGHGYNCFVSDHYKGDPGNRCNCGKDSLIEEMRCG